MDNELDVFYLEESPYMPGKYVLHIKHDKFHCKSTVGSYQLIPARLFNISFANFLRLCRDEYGAAIYGKGSAYPVPYFNNDHKARLLVKTLNKLAYMVEWERNNPEVLAWAEEKKNGKET